MFVLKKNKKDASFEHHENTTSQTRHIKIHDSNQRLDIDRTKPKRS